MKKVSLIWRNKVTLELTIGWVVTIYLCFLWFIPAQSWPLAEWCLFIYDLYGLYLCRVDRWLSSIFLSMISIVYTCVELTAGWVVTIYLWSLWFIPVKSWPLAEWCLLVYDLYTCAELTTGQVVSIYLWSLWFIPAQSRPLAEWWLFISDLNGLYLRRVDRWLRGDSYMGCSSSWSRDSNWGDALTPSGTIIRYITRIVSQDYYNGIYHTTYADGHNESTK
jgi:hypothetical protein